MNDNILTILAAGINAAYASTNTAKIAVGKLLNDARTKFASDKLFGTWCAKKLHVDLTRQTRWEMMQVARYVNSNNVDDTTINGLGWSGLLAAAKLLNRDIGNADRRVATEALNKTVVGNGKMTADKVKALIVDKLPEAYKPVSTATTKAADTTTFNSQADKPVTVSEVLTAKTLVVDVKGYGVSLEIEKTASGYALELSQQVKEAVMLDEATVMAMGDKAVHSLLLLLKKRTQATAKPKAKAKTKAVRTIGSGDLTFELV